MNNEDFRLADDDKLVGCAVFYVPTNTV